MKLSHALTAAGIATAAALTPIAVTPAQAQHRVVVVGGPSGPGWNVYRERSYRTGWAGPRYWDRAGPHRGYYAWNGNYYRNCSYRWVGRPGRRNRDWRCW
jgi:hypothetical protein